MTAWLKLIGSSDHPVTGHPWHGNFRDPTIGFRKVAKPSVRAGDAMLLYAPGGSRRIFALTRILADPVRDPNHDPRVQGSCYWMVPVHFEINRPVLEGLHIGEASLSGRSLMASIRQHSHIRLTPEEFAHICSRLRGTD